MVRKKSTQEKLLTEAELELMTILWRFGEGSVADVMASLPPGRNLAYTSVSTILRILEQKGVLDSRKEGRGHVYFPILSKAEYESTTLKHMVTKVFDGAPTTLVRRLIETEDLTREDLESLRSFLSSKLGKK